MTQENKVYRFLGKDRIAKEPSDDTIGDLNRDFSPEAFSGLTGSQQLEFILFRQLILRLLEVNNLSEVSSLLQEKALLSARKKRLIELYTGVYPAVKNFTFGKKSQLIETSFQDAEEVIQYLEVIVGNFSQEILGSIKASAEVTKTNDVIEILKILFDPLSPRKKRFEARRKLILMDKAMRLNLQRTENSQKMVQLLDFLKETLWENEDHPSLPPNKVVSYHSPAEYACEEVFLTENGIDPGPTHSQDKETLLRRVTSLNWKTFRNGKGKSIPVHIEHRVKTHVAQLLKMLRKDTANHLAIDDQLGLRLVFQTKRQSRDFLEMLYHAAQKVGSTVITTEVSDTIENSDSFKVTNPGSSSRLEIIKLHCTINGITFELQLHTIKSYLDYLYRHESGVAEFSVQRLLQSGIPELLYPEDISGIDFTQLEQSWIAEVRKQVEKNELLTGVTKADVSVPIRA